MPGCWGRTKRATSSAFHAADPTGKTALVQTGRHLRHRRCRGDRRRLGGPRPGPGTGRDCLGCRAGLAAQTPSRGGQCLAGTAETGSAPRRQPCPAALRYFPGDRLPRCGLRPGECARTIGRETRPARRDRRGRGSGRAHRVKHLRFVADPLAGRLPTTAARRRWSPLQSGLPAAPGGGARRQGYGTGKRRPGDGVLHRAWHAPLAGAQRDRRLPLRPAAGGTVAGGLTPGQRRCRDTRRARCRDHLRARAALGVHGNLSRVPHGGGRCPACITSCASSVRR